MLTNLKAAAISLILIILAASCSTPKQLERENGYPAARKKASTSSATKKTFVKPLKIDRSEFVAYAETLLGTPYKYGSAVPVNGLDCSGFVTVVFSHFNIKCPRTSVAFTNEGRDVDAKDARPGDIILFTGSDNSTDMVGHMGIITSNKNDMIRFVHSASGKNIGVILNDLKGYYKTHFVKVISVLE